MKDHANWKDGKGWGRSADDEYPVILYKRAIGELPEMESSKVVAAQMRNLVREGDHILDVGCGAGHYLRSLRSSIKVTFRYTGADATPLYLDYAKKAFQGVPNVDFTQGDIFALPFPDKSFDVVMCNNVLMHLPSVEQPIRELCRVAKRAVLFRTLVGENSFRVLESRTKGDEFHADGTPKAFAFLNIYSKAYIEHVFSQIPRITKFVIDEDWDYDSAKINDSAEYIKDHKNPTYMIGKWQRVGYILLPWGIAKLELSPS
ncbi:MAG: methyltransferase domain-containing protein [Deltaproteobacteria bacterium]|nr:methyltransferase domain-containing protein [Deltaproteobacteria bacterium]